jgi:hypothetical protein
MRLGDDTYHPPTPSLNKEGEKVIKLPSFVKKGRGVVAYSKISLLPARSSTSERA